MYSTIIISLFIILYLLILFKIIKINRLTFILIIVILFTFTIVIVNDKSEVNLNYIKITDDQQIKELWTNYSNYNLSKDNKITRSINPYNIDIKPNNVVYDSDYIYTINDNYINIIKINDLIITKRIELSDNPFLLYVTNSKLIVISEDSNNTIIYLYNKPNFELFKEYKIDCTYITSKYIDDYFYLVTTKKINDKDRPIYSINGNKEFIDYKDIYYINDTYSNNYVNITKIDLNDSDKVDIFSYLGTGQIINFSKDNIYIAEEEVSKDNKTVILKIDLTNLKLSGIKELNGNVLDEYSIGEYNKYLRVATSSNNGVMHTNYLYILDKDMQIVGLLDRFSVGAQIQSLVYLDNIAYIETYNELTPFYIVDLSNVKKPKIVNSMNFDGYNSYFHPYNLNHLLAFGYHENEDNFTDGIKISLYDISNPKEIIIKDEDIIFYDDYNKAYSDVLYNNDSLLINNDIIGFPVNYYINDNNEGFFRQFYLIYHLNGDKLVRIGKISHYEDSSKNNNEIKRVLIIKDKLYTISNNLIRVYNPYNLKIIKEATMIE